MLYALFALQCTLCTGIIISNSIFASTMFGVLVYVNTSLLLLFLGFEFMALINLLIYAGALAVLFMFVVMLVNIPLNSFFNVKFNKGLLAIFALYNTRFLNQSAADPVGSNSNNLLTLPHYETTGNLYNMISINESLWSIAHSFYIYWSDVLIINSLVLTVALVGALIIAHTRA